MIIDSGHFLFHQKGMGVTLDGQPVKHVSVVDPEAGYLVRFKTYMLDGKEAFGMAGTGLDAEIATEVLMGKVRLTYAAPMGPSDFPAYITRHFPDVAPYLDVLYAQAVR